MPCVLTTVASRRLPCLPLGYPAALSRRSAPTGSAPEVACREFSRSLALSAQNAWLQSSRCVIVSL